MADQRKPPQIGNRDMNRIAALVALAGIASVATLAHGQTTYNFNGLPMFVADPPAAAVTASTDAIAGAGAIVSVTCSVEWNPQHTYAADVDLILTFTPTGGSPVSVFLHNNIGGANNLFGTYIFTDLATANFGTGAVGGVLPAGQYRAMSAATTQVSLNEAFAGLPVAGTWTLSAQDFAGGDTGTIASATVTVVGGTAPVPPSGSVPPARLSRGAPGTTAPYSVLLTARGNPGANPTSAIASVSANLSTIGLSNNAVMYDDGSNGDAAAGDGLYSLLVTPAGSLAVGTYDIVCTVRDALNRTGSATGTLTVEDVTVADFGTLAFNATATEQTSSGDTGKAAWFKFTTAIDATDPDAYVDISVTANSGYADTYMAVFAADGTFLVSDDDDGAGLFSAISFGRTIPARPAIGTGRTPQGQDGGLPAGEYYVAVVQYFSTFSSPFGFSNVNTLASTATVSIEASNQAPAPINPTITGNFLPAARVDGLPVVQNTSLLRATVVPGQFPVSSGITVTAPLASLGLAGSATLLDDGTGGDEAAGDGIYSATINVATLAAGSYTVPVTVNDAEGRSVSVDVAFAVTSVTALGTITGTMQTSGSANNGGATAWFSLNNQVDASDPNGWLDLWVSASSGFGDSIIALFDASGNLIVTDDNDGPGLLSQLSFGRTAPARVRGTNTNGIGQDGSLGTGTYYLAVDQWNSAFTSPFTSSRAGSLNSDITVEVQSSTEADLVVAAAPAVVNVGGPGSVGGVYYATVRANVAPATPGYVFTADFSSMGGGTAVAMVDNGTNGDETAGDGIYTARYDVTAATSGVYPVTVNTTGAGILTGTVNFTINAVTVTDLGTLAFTGAGITHDNVIVGREVNWLRFELAQNVDAGGVLYLDIDTNGSSMDTHLGLFSSDGTFLAISDDDDGDGLDSALSFGSTDTTGRDTNPLGIANNGRDGGLASGVYYLALNFFPATYGTPFVATNTSGTTGGTYVVHLFPGAVGVVPPTCLSDINVDGTPADGGDFILFINSFGIGDATVDPLADVAGGGDPNRPEGGPDGNIDGTDFIAFINAFAAGC